MKTAGTPTIDCHPPERRRRTDIRICHCCCCCCCCLHTVGGIIGAGVAPAFGAGNRMPISYYFDEEDNVVVPYVAKTGASAVRVFWLLSLAATVFGASIGAVRGMGDFIVGLVLLALVLPAVQLGCAIMTLIWLAASARPDKSFQMRQVGRITLGLIVGTVAGIMVMVMMGIMMRAVR